MSTWRIPHRVCLAVVLLSGCGSNDMSGSKRAPRPVSVLRLEESDPGRAQRVAGSVASWKTEQLAFEVAGRVQYVIEPEVNIVGRWFTESQQLGLGGEQVPKQPQRQQPKPDAKQPIVKEEDKREKSEKQDKLAKKDESGKTGTLLARLDKTRYELAVKSAQAQIEMATQQRKAAQIEIDRVLPAQGRAIEAQRDLAQIEVTRNGRLVRQGAASQAELDRSRADLDTANQRLAELEANKAAKRAELASLDAKLQQLQQTLEEANRDVRDCQLYSPFDGQVADVQVINGGYVQRGQHVVTVQMMDPMVVEFEASAETVRRLNYRDAFPIHIPQPGGKTQQKVAFVYMTAPLPWLFAKCQQLLARRRKGAASSAEGGDVIDRVFRGGVRAAIDNKFATVGVSLALLAAVFLLPVGSEFFPKDIRDQFAIKILLPENVAIEQTDRVAKQVEEILRKLSPTTDASGNKVQRIRAMRTMVGGGGSRWYLGWNPEPRKPNFAEILVRTTDGRFTPQLAARVRQIAERGDPSLGIQPIVGARIVPTELYLGPSSDPVEIRVIGQGFADMKTLRSYADRVKAMVRNDRGTDGPSAGNPSTWDINDSWGVPGYQLRVNVDEEKANLAGVTNANVAQTLNAYFSGHHLTTFREGDHLVPVYLRLNPEERGDLDGLQTAFVEGLYGKVPLNSFATVDQRWEPSTIVRRDLNRVIEVRAQVEPGVRGNDVVNRLMRSEEMKQLEREMVSGYRVEVGGSLEDSQEGAEQLAVSLGISVLTIILLLVIQYNGWAKPVIILTTLPLALIGAWPGLWITGNALGFMPQLGILSLFGIVLNTGIIFIEFADMTIQEAAEKTDGSGPICGLSREQFRSCLVEAGKQRLLPIFLTTATTIGGLLPLALGGGPLWEGMAWCMIFGLIIATLLTLLVVPALYAIFVENLGVKPFRTEQPS